MAAYWKENRTLEIMEARKFWTEHYRKKGLRFWKLETVVSRKIRSLYGT